MGCAPEAAPVPCAAGVRRQTGHDADGHTARIGEAFRTAIILRTTSSVRLAPRMASTRYAVGVDAMVSSVRTYLGLANTRCCCRRRWGLLPKQIVDMRTLGGDRLGIHRVSQREHDLALGFRQRDPFGIGWSDHQASRPWREWVRHPWLFPGRSGFRRSAPEHCWLPFV